MNRIDELKQKRKEIDLEIKRLESIDYKQCGDVKFDKQQYSWKSPAEYFVCVKYRPATKGVHRWMSIARSTNRQEVIARIPLIIQDLQGLYESLMTDLTERKD